MRSCSSVQNTVRRKCKYRNWAHTVWLNLKMIASVLSTFEKTGAACLFTDGCCGGGGGETKERVHYTVYIKLYIWNNTIIIFSTSSNETTYCPLKVLLRDEQHKPPQTNDLWLTASSCFVSIIQRRCCVFVDRLQWHLKCVQFSGGCRSSCIL